ncbi:MAG: hypothetical protein ACTHJ3_17910, partial [Pararhizobium sp.]
MTQPERGLAGGARLLRLMRFLSRGPAVLAPADRAVEGSVRLEASDGRSLAVTSGDLLHAVSSGLVARRGSAAGMTPAGRAWLRRALSADDPFTSQHADLRKTTVEVEG